MKSSGARVQDVHQVACGRLEPVLVTAPPRSATARSGHAHEAAGFASPPCGGFAI